MMKFSLQLTLEQEIHCKLQETCYTLQSRAATCNSLKQSLPSLKKVETSSGASVTHCNFLCCNGVARQVSGRLQRVTRPLCNLLPDRFLGLQRLYRVKN